MDGGWSRELEARSGKLEVGCRKTEDRSQVSGVG